MPQVSLIATGSQLGKTTGQIHLSKLRIDGYTRTHAASGYRRVNPFEVEASQADDPSRADNKHYLGNWLNYLQQRVNTGSALLVSSGYGELDLTWVRPPGYTRAPSILEQFMFLKDGGTTVNTTTLSVNPFVDWFSKIPAGNVVAATIPASGFGGRYVAVGMKVEFDDSVVVHTNADSQGYDIAAGQDALIGGGRGVLVKVHAITPVCGPVRQLQDPSTCTVGSNVDIRVQLAMEGPSTGRLEESVNGGAFGLIDSAVAAGTNAEYPLVRASGNNYQYRLRYNDVSPDSWSTSSTFSASCTLV